MTMEEDLVLSLYPPPDHPFPRRHALEVVKSSKNKSRYRAPLLDADDADDCLGFRSRESTAPPEINDGHCAAAEVQRINYECLPCLQLKFSDQRKNANGWLLGRDPNKCDIVLPQFRD